MEHSNFRKDGCTSMVRLFSTRLGFTSEIVMLFAVTDERNIPPLGRIGDPDDIIASVRVQGGKVSFIAISTLNGFENEL